MTTLLTKAELIARFADGGNIDAAAARDLVFSAMAPPLQERRMIYVRNNVAGLSGLTIPASGADYWTYAHPSYDEEGFYFLPPDPALTNVHPNSYDPGGWHDPSYSLDGSDPRSGWGKDIPAGGAMTLPTGMFVAECFVFLDTVLDPATQAINLEIDQMEFDPDWSSPTPGDPWIYESYWARQQLSVPTTPWPDYLAPFTRYSGQAGFITGMLVNDNPDPMPFNFILSLFNTTSTVKVTYYNMAVTQVGGPGW